MALYMGHPADTNTYEEYLRRAEDYRVRGLTMLEADMRKKAQKAYKAKRFDKK